MIKRIFFIIFLFLQFTYLYADKFQIKFQERDDVYIVSYAIIKVYDDNDREIFKDLTDKYGRITINLPNEEYKVKIFRGKSVYITKFRITGFEGQRIIILRRII